MKMRKQPLTKRQHEILIFLQDYIGTRGYAPTLEEIMRHFRLRSVATIHKHLSHLERKGAISRNWNQRRSVMFQETMQTGVVELPLLGYVAAGTPIEAVAEQETITIPHDMLGRRETYVLRVRGDSMIDEQIRDGDFIIVESRNEAQDGEVVVALVNGNEVTVKKLYREPPDMIRLQPANTSMLPIVLPAGQVIIQGVVMGILRKFRHG